MHQAVWTGLLLLLAKWQSERYPKPVLVQSRKFLTRPHFVTRYCLPLVAVLFCHSSAEAKFDLECYIKNNCGRAWHGTTTNPSAGGQVKINPSAVPIEAGFGIEGLFFKQEVDVAIVRGNGRVGAAISPSNSEETFFGPPGFELESKYYERKLNAEKFPNQKYTLATAIGLVDKAGSGLHTFTLRMGLMAKYNKLTKNVTPGAGLSGVLGPLTFGGSIYNDETQIEDPIPDGTNTTRITYQVQTYNVGVFLSSLIVDYSHLRLQIPDNPDISEVNLVTASLLVDKFILTAAKRTENSSRRSFNYDTKLLETKQIKEDVFGGIQYAPNKNLMFGLLYNYYLLNELSVAATIFF